MKIYYQGIKGSYSSSAILKHFPFSNIENQNDLQIQDQDEEPF